MVHSLQRKPWGHATAAVSLSCKYESTPSHASVAGGILQCGAILYRNWGLNTFNCDVYLAPACTASSTYSSCKSSSWTWVNTSSSIPHFLLSLWMLLRLNASSPRKNCPALSEGKRCKAICNELCLVMCPPWQWPSLNCDTGVEPQLPHGIAIEVWQEVLRLHISHGAIVEPQLQYSIAIEAWQEAL